MYMYDDPFSLFHPVNPKPGPANPKPGPGKPKPGPNGIICFMACLILCLAMRVPKRPKRSLVSIASAVPEKFASFTPPKFA